MSMTKESTALEALAELVPRCDAGHGPRSRVAACEDAAIWAARTHHPFIPGACPAIVLLCDAHLERARKQYGEQWEKLARIPLPKVCGMCGGVVTGLEDMLWNIERLRP